MAEETRDDRSRATEVGNATEVGQARGEEAMTGGGESPRRAGKGGCGAEVQVVVALGSNLGDRESHLREGVRALSGMLRVERVSRIMETPPWGDTDQGPFLNVVVLGRTDHSPWEIMDALLQVERSRGRLRTRPGGARTLDLDLILHGDAVLREPGLALPHPRWHLRTFVALPLLELLPHGIDPETGAPLAERVGPEVFREPHHDRGALSGWEVGVGLSKEGR